MVRVAEMGLVHGGVLLSDCSSPSPSLFLSPFPPHLSFPLPAPPSLPLSVNVAQTMEEFIKTSSLEEDGGYYCMEAFMRVVRKLEHLHSKLRCGHGAFSGETEA